jgi:fused signal recognition particle receptor
MHIGLGNNAPIVLGLLALIFFLAAGLLVAARLRARKPSTPAAALPRQALISPPAARTPRVAEPPEPLPSAPLETPEERRQRREEEEAEKRAAYRARKEQEIRERDERKKQAELDAQREADEARRRSEEESKRILEEASERRRKEQAEAGKTLLEGLTKTRGGFINRLNGLLRNQTALPDTLLAELEGVLLSADIGVKTAARLVEVARENLGRRDLSNPDRIKGAIRKEVERIVSVAVPSSPGGSAQKPAVWMIVGVNGVGKTTTIGKLAAQETARGRRVVLGAADTFRAAAAEQLAIWAQRAGADFIRAAEGSDPGSVAYDAVRRGIETGADVVMVDTAGRLHTKVPLMEELRKVKRVLEKARPGAPDEVLLVLDSTNGQNAIAQARQFHEALGITGIILTKLDGTAKGGVVIGICEELKIPVRYVGIGEDVGDLKHFEPRDFVEALFA